MHFDPGDVPKLLEVNVAWCAFFAVGREAGAISRLVLVPRRVRCRDKDLQGS
jgi:hypothetical protein